MENEVFDKLVRHEIEFLRYYSRKDSRAELTEDSDFYRDLRKMGYTKRDMPLDLRCSPGIVTADEETVEGMDIALLKQYQFPRDASRNRYSLLEAFVIIYPEKKKWVIEQLNKLNK